jgi:hypothetical protein
VSGVQPGQLWISPEPETYYVSAIGNDGTVCVVPVRISGTGPHAQIIRKGDSKSVKTSEMLELWMPTAKTSEPGPTWHERIMADED